jgi:YHS domain-containing protein
MWRILVYVILLGIVYWVVKRALFPRKKQPGNLGRPGEVLVQDPVCKCYLPKSQARALDLKGEKVFFCSEECRRKFLGGNALPDAKKD